MPQKHLLSLFTLSSTFLNFNKLHSSFSDFSNHFYIHPILLCFSWYFFASLFLTEFKCMLFLSEKNLREYPKCASMSGVARVRHKLTQVPDADCAGHPWQGLLPRFQNFVHRVIMGTTPFPLPSAFLSSLPPAHPSLWAGLPSPWPCLPPQGQLWPLAQVGSFLSWRAFGNFWPGHFHPSPGAWLRSCSLLVFLGNSHKQLSFCRQPDPET